MKPPKLAISVSVFLVVWLVGLGVTTAEAGGAKVVWERMTGVIVPNRIVGVRPGVPCTLGVNCVQGPGIPWTVTKGRAEVDLEDGDIKFDVKGLVFSCCPGFGPVGTPAAVTEVRGILVCNATGEGVSTLVDTMPAVALGAQGDARFRGNVTLPDACTDEADDIAFLIRIAGVIEDGPDPAFAIGLWIAHGSVRKLKDGGSD